MPPIKAAKLLKFVFPINVHKLHPSMKLHDITFQKTNFNSQVRHFINLSVLELNAWSYLLETAADQT